MEIELFSGATRIFRGGASILGSATWLLLLLFSIDKLGSYFGSNLLVVGLVAAASYFDCCMPPPPRSNDGIAPSYFWGVCLLAGVSMIYLYIARLVRDL